MTPPRFRIATRDVPDADGLLRSMQHEARGLWRRYPALSAFHFELAASGAGFEAHIDLRFPQHQLTVNGAGNMPNDALRQAVTAAARELMRLEARDPSVAAPMHAKAA
jgi:hypothetical protein